VVVVFVAYVLRASEKIFSEARSYGWKPRISRQDRISNISLMSSGEGKNTKVPLWGFVTNNP
jgi:hypothetical protein